MNSFFKYLKNHVAEFLRAFVIAALFFAAAYLIDTLWIRVSAFVALTLLFVFTRMFYPPGVQEDLQVLEEDIQKMAEGNLSLTPAIQSSSRIIRDFATSLVVLLGRLRQIVEKVKNVADSVTGIL